MPPIKLDFAVESIDQYQDAVSTAKAGTSVTFQTDDTTSQLSVLDQNGAQLGHVPTLLQQALAADTFTATIRSCRRQENKVTELLVRAVADGGQQAAVQLPGKSNLHFGFCALQTSNTQPDS